MSLRCDRGVECRIQGSDSLDSILALDKFLNVSGLQLPTL